MGVCMDKKLFKSIILLITYCIFLIAIIVKIDVLAGVFANGIRILSPLFIGVAIAFVLKRPYKFFLKTYQNTKKRRKINAAAKPLAIVSVYVLFIGVITGIVAFIIPQIVDSVKLLYDNLGNYASNFEAFVNGVSDYLKVDTIDLSSLEATLVKVPDILGGLVTGLMPQIFNFTSGFIHQTINIVIGFILSIYLLVERERIKRQVAEILKAYTKQSFETKTKKVFGVIDDTFTKFVSGQITEAFILGILCFIGMLIFRIEYPMLISVMIGTTSLIPVVGAIIGLIPSIFILLMIEPVQALWFLVFIIVLQQLEGNLIYPKVVGGSIGLPALWVLLAIIVGGGLFGIIGMLLGVPTMSVIYQLVREDVNTRLN